MIKTDNKIFFEGHLHWMVFLWPVCGLILGVGLYQTQHLYVIGWPIILISLIWGGYSFLNYVSCSIQVVDNFLIIRTGILVRQTRNFSIQKIESVDVAQSILGCILDYGVLSISGTGGTCAFFGPMAKPLTCRRFLESMPNANENGV